MRLDINTNASWAAITWFRDNHLEVEDPEFKERFEQMFHCKIVWEEVKNEMKGYIDKVPSYLDFDDEKCYTMFLLRWSGVK